jgi:hypothetical protein
VHVDKTQVTPGGLAVLRAALPQQRKSDEERARLIKQVQEQRRIDEQRDAQLPGLQLPAQDKADAEAP